MTTSLERKVRWGVLGYARIARDCVMPAMMRSTNAELYALASRHEAKLAEARGKFPLAQTYAGYEALLADPAVEAVYIPLPNSEHRPWVLRAIERGKHVLCEKPLGLNAAECREMMAAADRRGVRLMEAFMYRYTNRTARVREVLRSGALGEVRFISATFRFLLNRPESIKWIPELGGGALYDVGCYPVNFVGLVADEIAGQPDSGSSAPDIVAATCVRERRIDVSFSAVLRYASGLIANIHCGFDAHKHVRAEIVGTQGVLEIPDTFFDNAGELTLVAGEERRSIPVAESDRYRAEIEDFSDAIRRGRLPAFGLAESLRNAAVLDRLFAAAAAPA
ncbi:MAG TPA: Gfo/Idh/MocA family oxidoreductase [Lacunisphaera sp.]|nr:Gfo/Idh/MocA family oxidoreductase [Lacunisphaera sp.]